MHLHTMGYFPLCFFIRFLQNFLKPRIAILYDDSLEWLNLKVALATGIFHSMQRGDQTGKFACLLNWMTHELLIRRRYHKLIRSPFEMHSSSFVLVTIYWQLDQKTIWSLYFFWPRQLANKKDDQWEKRW